MSASVRDDVTHTSSSVNCRTAHLQLVYQRCQLLHRLDKSVGLRAHKHKTRHCAQYSASPAAHCRTCDSIRRTQRVAVAAAENQQHQSPTHVRTHSRHRTHAAHLTRQRRRVDECHQRRVVRCIGDERFRASTATTYTHTHTHAREVNRARTRTRVTANSRGLRAPASASACAISASAPARSRAISARSAGTSTTGGARAATSSAGSSTLGNVALTLSTLADGSGCSNRESNPQQTRERASY
jgi:hypothetical protein